MDDKIPQAPQCSATKSGTGKRCVQAAEYRCSQLHVVCVYHTLRLAGQEKRRKTDRKCKVCMDEGKSSSVALLGAPKVQRDRRTTADKPLSA
ncbi:MAG TPA: hypothetical protein VGZ02_02310 [Candidatus Baltobacteraceae bacterium]|jgi:hypothetical protein|nr:hypothetical protein [Candidatus Baltobacteraceae bacterium]